MDSKKIRISISRLAGRLGLGFCSLITKVMPGSWLYGFARGIAFLGYCFARKQRNIALESLNIAFSGEKSSVSPGKRYCFNPQFPGFFDAKNDILGSPAC
jgi:lauroyl/myristoyl acyltransferase